MPEVGHDVVVKFLTTRVVSAEDALLDPGSSVGAIFGALTSRAEAAGT